MNLKTYRSLRPGDRLIVEQNGMLRTARVKGWSHRVLCCQLKRFRPGGWCPFVVPVYRGECVQITHTQGQQHIETILNEIKTADAVGSHA